MAQDYTEIAATQTIENSRNLLLNNTKTALSMSSGTSAPTTNLQIGMPFFNTTDGTHYTLISTGPDVWDPFSAGRLYDDILDDGTQILPSQFVRSDQADTVSGKLTYSASEIDLTNSSPKIIFGSGNTARARITRNDGSGASLVLRSGNYYNSGPKYAVTGDGAVKMDFTSDSAAGSWSVSVAPTGTAGSAITFGNSLTLDTTNGLRYNGNDILTDADTGALGAATLALETAKQTIYLPAGAMEKPITNPAIGLEQVELTAGNPSYFYYDFPTSVLRSLEFSVAFPKGWTEGTVSYKVFWSSGNSGIGDVVWELSGVAISDDDPIDVAYGSVVQVTDTFITTNDMHVSAESGAITIAGTPAEADIVQFRLSRNGADSSDTKAETVRLHGIKLFYTVNSFTDV